MGSSGVSLSAAMGLPDWISQTRARPSLEHDAKYLLQKLMSMELIAIVWPLRDCRRIPLEADQILIKPMSSPVRRSLPVLDGDK